MKAGCDTAGQRGRAANVQIKYEIIPSQIFPHEFFFQAGSECALGENAWQETEIASEFKPMRDFWEPNCKLDRLSALDGFWTI